MKNHQAGNCALGDKEVCELLLLNTEALTGSSLPWIQLDYLFLGLCGLHKSSKFYFFPPLFPLLGQN